MERNAFGLMAPLTCWGLITCFEQARGQVIMGVAFALTIGATFGVLERHLEGAFPLIRAAHPIGVLLFSGWFLWWNRSAGDVKPVGQVPVRKPPRAEAGPYPMVISFSLPNPTSPPGQDTLMDRRHRVTGCSGRGWSLRR